MKNSADLGEYYPPRPTASVDNTLLDQQNSSYPTQPHSIIANYDDPNEYINDLLERYGKIQSVRYQHWTNLPEVSTATRIVEYQSEGSYSTFSYDWKLPL